MSEERVQGEGRRRPWQGFGEVETDKEVFDVSGEGWRKTGGKLFWGVSVVKVVCCC